MIVVEQAFVTAETNESLKIYIRLRDENDNRYELVQEYTKPVQGLFGPDDPDQASPIVPPEAVVVTFSPEYDSPRFEDEITDYLKNSFKLRLHTTGTTYPTGMRELHFDTEKD